jgi:hypothetical protein
MKIEEQCPNRFANRSFFILIANRAGGNIRQGYLTFGLSLD